MFFSFWVEELWGSFIAAFLGTMFLYLVICLLGRLNAITTITLLAAYVVVMGIGFLGIGFFIPIMIFSIWYLWVNVNRFANR